MGNVICVKFKYLIIRNRWKEQVLRSITGVFKSISAKMLKSRFNFLIKTVSNKFLRMWHSQINKWKFGSNNCWFPSIN